MTPVETMDEGAAQAVAHRRGAQVTMSIFLDKNSKVIVQGITGAEGSYHTDRMVKYGTKIVGGVTPGKGGQQTPARPAGLRHGQRRRSKRPGRPTRCIFVPPPFAADALYEAYEAGITLAVCITEGVPVHDMLKVVGTTRRDADHRPELPRPDLARARASVGIMPGHVFKEGNVGLISRSGHADL